MSLTQSLTFGVKKVPDEQLLTTKDVARRLKVHPGTVHRWRRDKLLVAVEMPGQPRFHLSDVEAFIEGRRAPSRKAWDCWDY